MNKRIEEIRNILRGFVPYEEALELKNELNKIANDNYIQKYSDTEHIDFISRNNDCISIKEEHPQNTNFPYYLTMFTIVTQHIRADNVRQILDKGIDIEKSNELYNNL
ncbi:hypothetical protein G1K66_12370 [Tenacibaculum finnmarkense]|uniref:hypothetical protein n=1 Tax=Tenacibaculum finnmarkense TaxID=2781243 RepID=UPI001E5F46FD|nr:hypothetical protein [Tenacibaculum finnmarkense]MCD8401303.1 hypothetical protein [Tenacibaculum finnmarkense genomovar ulcerans]MCG8786430.1 hypothetical protein [Tenacibaculum finnmarkense]MCG8814051.1 hypothetical protein [Tenacibaculum finnmarkense]